MQRWQQIPVATQSWSKRLPPTTDACELRLYYAESWAGHYHVISWDVFNKLRFGKRTLTISWSRVYTTYSCCISMVRRLTHVHSQIFASFCMRPSPLKPSTDDLFWRGIWCPASHATGWSNFLRQFLPLRSHAPSQFIGLMSNDQPCEFEWHCLFIPCSFRNLNKLPVFSWNHGLYDCSILAYLRIP